MQYRLAIIGLGLIGGSLALALRRTDADIHITACDRNAATLEEAKNRQLVDAVHEQPQAAVRDADVVVIALPQSSYAALLNSIQSALLATAVITDVSSVKQSVLAQAEQYLGEHFPRFVGGHPIAGTEHSGLSAAFPELFVQHRVILTPTAATAEQAVAQVRTLWQQAGAIVTLLDPVYHDQVLAQTSHLPHLLAYALVDCLSQSAEKVDTLRYAAGGFADFTRIASSNPEMWRDICTSNREPLLQALEKFSRHTDRIRLLLERNEAEELLQVFAAAKAVRDQFKDMRKSESSPGISKQAGSSQSGRSKYK